MSKDAPRPLRVLLQGVNYAAFMVVVWYFASSPAITLIGDNEAQLTVAFAHAGQLREPCRQLTQEELNKLAPNMRKLEDCPRERSPVNIEIELDGDLVYQKSLPPPGLFGDGSVDVYFSTRISAGKHRLVARLNDSVHIEGFNHRFVQTVDLSAAQILLMGFDRDSGFVLRNFNQ